MFSEEFGISDDGVGSVGLSSDEGEGSVGLSSDEGEGSVGLSSDEGVGSVGFSVGLGVGVGDSGFIISGFSPDSVVGLTVDSVGSVVVVVVA